jgi:hypothetical protein
LCESVKIESDGITCSSSDAKAYFRLTCDGKNYYSFDYKNGDSKRRDYTFDNTEKCKSAKKVECAVSKNDDKN